MPNVKAGDMAYITHPSLLGKLVTVLHEAPVGRHALPDGYPGFNDGLAGLIWICESLGAPFRAPVKGGRFRGARFCGIEDRWLRPIRGESAGETESTPVEQPVETEVA